MTEFSGQDVAHLAELSRLQISADELEQFSTQLPKIVEFVEQLREVKLGDDTENIVVVDLQALRDDVEGTEHLSMEQLAKLAPDWDAITNQLRVPAVFGEADNE